VIIREAHPGELAQIGDLRVAAYVADGFLAENSGYTPRLRSLGADGTGTVLVAVLDDEIAGTVMIQAGSHAAEVVQGPDEAEVRALAVAPRAQGHGIGWALLRAAIDRAAAQGTRHLVLLTRQEMRTAHRLYERAGFQRRPERDWTPQPGIVLIAYGLRLDEPSAEPPAGAA